MKGNRSVYCQCGKRLLDLKSLVMFTSEMNASYYATEGPKYPLRLSSRYEELSGNLLIMFFQFI